MDTLRTVIADVLVSCGIQALRQRPYDDRAIRLWRGADLLRYVDETEHPGIEADMESRAITAEDRLVEVEQELSEAEDEIARLNKQIADAKIATA